jgi:DNA-binding NarL/FixJ family response regulator
MFTKRQRQILLLIAKGLTSKDIANSLFISLETVKRHRKNMIRKATEEGLKFDSLLRLAIQLTEKG